MVTFLLLIGVAILAAVWWRLYKLTEESEALNSRLRDAEIEIVGLKQAAEAAKPPSLTPAPPPQEAEAAVGLRPARAFAPPAPPVPPPPAEAPPTLSLPDVPPLPVEPPRLPPLPRPPERIKIVAELAPRKAPLSDINWEQFMGVKFLAWLGGFGLFLGITYYVKWAFDNNLVPPALRVGLGFLAGLGLLLGGVLLKRKDYAVTAQTLCATGVVVLYATTFACRAVYHFEFFQLVPTFLMMALITVAAFLLAVRMEAQVVAVLGMLGGFLTPVLLGSDVDNPVGLFTYIALLDAGLVAVALHRRWHYLVTLGAAGTILTQIGWAAKFFVAAKAYTALAIFLGFDAFFLAAFVLAQRGRQADWWVTSAAVAAPAVSLGFVLYLLSFSELGRQPWVLFSFILGADACLLALVVLESKLHSVHLVAGVAVFLLLSIWTVGHLTVPLLNWGLGAYFWFAVLHSVFPLVLQRLRPHVAPVWWAHLFPPLALLLAMMPIFRFVEVSWLLWPCVLLIDVLAVGLALLTASLAAILAVLMLTVVATAIWLLRVPMVVADLPEILLIIGGFAVFFFLASLFAGKKVFGSLAEALQLGSGPGLTESPLGLKMPPEQLRAQIPAVSAILPFLLLIMVVAKLAPADPSPVFGLALLLTGLTLGVTRAFRFDALAAVGLICVLVLEHAWHGGYFEVAAAPVALAWYLGFYAAFTLFPFLFHRAFEGRTLTWAVAALAGPAHFYLMHDLVKVAWPNDYMGLLPAAFAVPSLLAVGWLVRQVPVESPKRTALLAWFGGVALFFITLIFPIQFERQWITLGWALEGAALLWLFQRLPHPGLRLAGCGLMAAAFVRLALNPAVLAYQPRASTAILNWYLYAYGLTSACLLAGAWLLRPPRHDWRGLNLSALLTTLGVVLAFLLLNIEIADYFTPEGARRLVFEFSGHFGRDMTYSIAWALYALALLVAGLWQGVRAARYAGLGLLSATLVKLFFHDLSRLAQLYRVGALVGVAAIAILASFLYQRFYATAKR